jgi:hypothetical protein
MSAFNQLEDFIVIRSRRTGLSLAMSLLISTVFVAGCSNPREDVRVTLCKDIVRTQVGSSTVLQGADTQTKGYEYAAVRVRFSSQGRDAQAVCYYSHDAGDDTALNLSDPLSAYATSPFEVNIDGQKLNKPGLAEAIKQAMLKQGRDFVDAAKQGIQEAIQR